MIRDKRFGHLRLLQHFRMINHFDHNTKVNFDLVYSDDGDTLRVVLPKISEVWNVRNANGSMNVD